MKAIPKQSGHIIGFSALESRTRAALATSPPVLWHTKNTGRPILYRLYKLQAVINALRAFGWHTSRFLVLRKRSSNWPAKESKLSSSAGTPWSKNITLAFQSIFLDSVMSQGSWEASAFHVFSGSAPMAGTATILYTVSRRIKNKRYLVVRTLPSFHHWFPGLYSAYAALSRSYWFHLPPLSSAAQDRKRLPRHTLIKAFVNLIWSKMLSKV